MNEVAALGYAVITAEKPTEWKTFGEDILGFQVVDAPEGGSGEGAVRFRIDDRAWRFAVEPGSDGGLVALGFEVSNRQALDSLRTRLEDAGVMVKDAGDLVEKRDVLGLFRAEDPLGVPLEFYYGARSESLPFVSKYGVRFVTGDQGFGHCVLLTAEPEVSYGFYVDQLGFRVSDVIQLGPISLTFTSPSSRHHAIAFGGGAGMPSRIQHFMFQVDEIDAMGHALDRVLDNDVLLHRSIGRHTNDRMLSFYCLSPSGVAIEYGWGGLEVDSSSHSTGYYNAASSWGHRPPA